MLLQNAAIKVFGLNPRPVPIGIRIAEFILAPEQAAGFARPFPNCCKP